MVPGRAGQRSGRLVHERRLAVRRVRMPKLAALLRAVDAPGYLLDRTPAEPEDQGGTRMGKALLGTHVAPSSVRLLDEVRVLRQRVAELERALAEAEAAREQRELTADEREPAHS